MRSLLGGFGGKESTCQCRRCGFYPWVGTIPWRRKWQPTPVLLSGESPGQRSLVGYSPWGHRVRHGLVAEYACNHVQGFHFLHLLASICYLWYFWWWPFWPEWGDISLWFLISIFLIKDKDVEHLFINLLAICVSSLEKCPFFSWVVFWYWVLWAIYICWILLPYQSYRASLVPQW